MSRNQRMGLLLAALAVVVVAVVVAVASGGGDDEDGQAAQAQSRTTTQPETDSGDQGAQTETGTEEPHETVPAEPKPTQIQIRGGQVAGGPADIQVKKGDPVRIVVSSDAHDDIHLHGYDIEKPVEPGKPARFNFTADIEGIFELESHVAEDAGRDPLVGKLTVEPN